MFRQIILFIYFWAVFVYFVQVQTRPIVLSKFRYYHILGPIKMSMVDIPLFEVDVNPQAHAQVPGMLKWRFSHLWMCFKGQDHKGSCRTELEVFLRQLLKT